MTLPCPSSRKYKVIKIIQGQIKKKIFYKDFIVNNFKTEEVMVVGLSAYNKLKQIHGVLIRCYDLSFLTAWDTFILDQEERIHIHYHLYSCHLFVLQVQIKWSYSHQLSKSHNANKLQWNLSWGDSLYYQQNVVF